MPPAAQARIADSMLKRLRQSLVTTIAAWLLLVAGVAASAEMAIDSVHVHTSTAIASAGHGADRAGSPDAAMDQPDGWHLPGGSGCSSGESGECAHCQHAAGSLVQPNLPAEGPAPARNLPASGPVAAWLVAASEPPHRPPIA